MHYSSSERSNSSEVRVRRDVSGWFVGVAGLGFVLGLGIVASAQTTAHTPAPAATPAAALAAVPSSAVTAPPAAQPSLWVTPSQADIVCYRDLITTLASDFPSTTSGFAVRNAKLLEYVGAESLR